MASTGNAGSNSNCNSAELVRITSIAELLRGKTISLIGDSVMDQRTWSGRMS